MRRDHLYINVKVYGGADIEAAIAQMAALASRLRISVWSEINGIRTLARPDDWPERIFEAWKTALASGGKIASAGSNAPPVGEAAFSPLLPECGRVE